MSRSYIPLLKTQIVKYDKSTQKITTSKGQQQKVFIKTENILCDLPCSVSALTFDQCDFYTNKSIIHTIIHSNIIRLINNFIITISRIM